MLCTLSSREELHPEPVFHHHKHPPPRVGGRGQRTFYYSALYLYCTLLYTVLTVSARGPRRVYTRAGKLFRFAYLYRSAVLSAGL